MLQKFKIPLSCMLVLFTVLLPACLEAPKSEDPNSTATTTGTKSATITIVDTSLQASSRESIKTNDEGEYLFSPQVIDTSTNVTITLLNTGDLAAEKIKAYSLKTPLSYAGGSYPGTGGTCTTKIASQSTCTIVISFSPDKMGTNTVTLQLGYFNGKTTRNFEKIFKGTGISNPLPTVVTPSRGKLSGGSLVTLSGTQFYTGASVAIGGKPCTVTSITEPSLITCVLSSHSAASVDVVVTNTDGNSGTLAGGYTYQPAPTVTGVSLNSGALAGGTAVTITGTGFVEGATVDFGGSSCNSPNIVSSTSITCTTSMHSAGSVIVTVTNSDEQFGSANGAYTYQAAPVVTSVSLNAGALAGGTTVTITGSGFLSGATASIGGVTCTSPNVTSLTSMTCTTGAHAAGLTNIVVTNSDLQSGTGSNLYTYRAAPTVTAVSLTGGALAGGATITVTGTGFVTGATVSVGSVSCSSPTVLSSTSMTCITGAHAAGVTDIVVTNPDTQTGTGSNLYTYRAAPTVTQISPRTATLAGGTTVTISGTGFVSGATVTLGSASCTSVNVVSALSLTCTTPSASTPVAVDVNVTNSDTQVGTFTKAFAFIETSDSWTAMTTTGAPFGSRNFAAVWTGSKMITWGGWPNTSNGGVYDPATDSWVGTSTVNRPGFAENRTAYAWTGKQLILWGGYNGGTGVNTGGYFDPIANSWTQMTTLNAPTGAYSASGAWTGSKFIVWGGESNFVNRFNTGGVYDLEANSWTLTSTTGAPSPRFTLTGQWTGSEFLVLGGHGSSDFNDGGRYNPYTNTWTLTSTIGAPVSISLTSVWTGSKMLVWGGHFGNASNIGGIYDYASNTWTKITTTGAPSPRYTHVLTWIGNRMIAWGHRGQVNTGGIYNPDTNTWVTMTTLNAPSAAIGRQWCNGVWTGSKFIVWGGTEANDAGVENTGGVYTPPVYSSADTWTAISTNGAPAVRYNHMMVWSGSKLLVWGGFDGVVYRNDGGVYDPTTNSWTAMDTTNAPTTRHGASVAWSGKEMLIWGGYGGSFLNTGGRYDLLNNTWDTMTTTGAPSTRSSHASAWTGRRLVVWGGWNGSRHITGGQYDADTNTWTDTTTVNAPENRISFGNAWTGNQLFIWGGERGPTINTGGLYNPFTNSWTATPTTGAPTGVMYPCTAFVQGKIYIGTDTVLKQYDPLANSWASKNTTNMPNMNSGCVAAADKLFQLGHVDGGYGHFYNPALDHWNRTSISWTNYWGSTPAVWTGSKMIIWGGGANAQNFGHYYSP